MKNKLNFIIDENITDRIESIKKRVKNGKLKIQKKKVKSQVLKKYKRTDLKRKKILSNARKKAHGSVPDTKRDISNNMRKGLNTLSENFDFIEESFGYGDMLDVTMYESPKETVVISESIKGKIKKRKFKTIGEATGIFAPIGEMSRNNRIYAKDHYSYILENKNLSSKIETRGMLGTIGHHDKKVDDTDLAEGKVSHIITSLEIIEEEDGTENLYGILEILDTPAGNLLKTYYESGVPLYVSSRGGGKLVPVANESYKLVDKKNYYLETFDVVKEPGFLQAKPEYVSESEDDTEELEYNNEEHEMKSKNTNKEVILEEKMETKVAITPELDAEEVVKRLIQPLDEKFTKLTELVETLVEKVFEADEEEKEEDDKEEKEDDKEEGKEEKEVCESTEEVVSESAEEVVAEEVTEAPVEEVVEEVVAEEAPIEEVVAEEVTEAPVEEVTEVVSESVEVTEEFVTPKKDAETESEEEKDAPVADNLANKPAEASKQLVEEIDYKQKYEDCEDIVEELTTLVAETSEKFKTVTEQVDEANTKIDELSKELHSYKLNEEFNITLEEAKEKLAEKSYEEIVEELKTTETTEVDSEISETVEKISEEFIEEVKEDSEESKSTRKTFSLFNRIDEKKEEPKQRKTKFNLFS